MDADHVLYVGSKKEIVDFDSFKEALRREIHLHTASGTEEREMTVVLSVDRRVDYGSFLRLFALAQETNVKLRLVYQDTSNAPS